MLLARLLGGQVLISPLFGMWLRVNTELLHSTTTLEISGSRPIVSEHWELTERN
jgi:hypothetical protein